MTTPQSPTTGPGSAATRILLDTSRLSMCFQVSDHAPVSMSSVTVDGRQISFGVGEVATTGTLRQPVQPQPLVEVFTDHEQHARSGQRRIGSAVGARLRYLGHHHSHEPGRQILHIDQHDPHTGVQVRLTMTVDVDIAAVWTQVELLTTSRPATIIGVSTLVLAPDGTGADFALDSTSCCWAQSSWLAENRWTQHPLRTLLPDLNLPLHGQDPRGSVSITGRGSWSTGDHLPMAVLTSDNGPALGVQIDSSAGWCLELGERRSGPYLLASGPEETTHTWRAELTVGGREQLAPVVVAFSADGRDGVIAELTRHRRRRRRPHPDDAALPVIYNDFMNTLDGDPTADRVLPLVAAAAEVGAEIYVLDAGWYDDDADWWDGVGTWQPSPRRFPNGLGEIAAAVRRHGMRFGLWLEPEVVGVRSPAAVSLPTEAFLQRNGRRVVEHGRFHLDLRHRAARTHLDQVVDRLVTDLDVSYLKLDYNISAVSGTDGDGHAAGYGRAQAATAYQTWLTTLADRHPSLTVETCSSGAMRADSSLLSISQLQSTSDQQDLIRYPPVAASAPMSMPPEQAANWAYPQPGMAPEAATFTLTTAMLGRFYLSGFLDQMSAAERGRVAAAIAAYRQIRRRLADTVPQWPLGLPGWDDPVVALALHHPSGTLLTVWDRSGTGRPIDIPLHNWIGLPVTITPLHPFAADGRTLRWHHADGHLELRFAAGHPAACTMLLRAATTPGTPGDRDHRGVVRAGDVQ